jgi:hypothetical protein
VTWWGKPGITNRANLAMPEIYQFSVNLSIVRYCVPGI